MHSESARRLTSILQTVPASLRSITDAESSARPAPGKWCKKEVLGHLIDSATNNHQRCVRAQIGNGELVFPGYAQDDWVSLQHYRDTPWQELIELWVAYNRHLSRLIGSASESKLQTPCRIGASAPVTLAYLMEDYVRHLEHHLGQILGGDWGTKG